MTDVDALTRAVQAVPDDDTPRLVLADALDVIAPEAFARGVTLALKPMHPAVAAGGSFLTSPVEAAAWVERFDHPGVRIALDLWQFGHDRGRRPPAREP